MSPFPQAIAAAQLEALHVLLARVLTELIEINIYLENSEPHTLGPMSPQDFETLVARVRRAKSNARLAFESTEDS